MDLIDPAWVADLFDRPEEDPLGAILGGFGTDKVRTGGFGVGGTPFRTPKTTHSGCARVPGRGSLPTSGRRRASLRCLSSKAIVSTVAVRQEPLQAMLARALVDA